MAKVSDAHLEARRRSILEAATLVFSRKGVESATMAEIARLAGISPGAIYRYFESKEALARGCMSENSFAVQSQWKSEAATGADAWAGFRELARKTFSLIHEPEERADTILFLEGVLAAVRDDDRGMVLALCGECEETVSGIQRRLQAARDQLSFDSAINSRHLAEALYSFYWGARLTHLIDPQVDTDAQFNELIAILERAAGRV
jgi:AcrR family transcriptional regulator